jgi:8-oxo-dGTP pyrophosphatase MutT (NUDIX family)
LILPEDLHHHVTLVDQREPPRPKTVRARHAASLLVWREAGDSVEILMGMRGARHRFMPNRLVFPGGAVDRSDLSAPVATGLLPRTEAALRRNANAKLAVGLGVAAARELQEETGFSLGSPPALGGLEYLARAVTPADSPIRFNARFFCIHASQVTGALGGDGELDNLRYYGMTEALALDLAGPTRRMLEQLRTWLTLSEAEREERTHVQVLKHRGWQLE